MSGGVGARHFVMHEDGSFERLPTSILSAIIDDEYPLPDYAGQWLKVLELIVSLENRQVVGLIRAAGMRLKVDDRGFVRESFLKSVSKAMDRAHGGARRERPNKGVVSLEHVRKKHDPYHWTPTPEEAQAALALLAPRPTKPRKVVPIRPDVKAPTKKRSRPLRFQRGGFEMVPESSPIFVLDGQMTSEFLITSDEAFQAALHMLVERGSWFMASPITWRHRGDFRWTLYAQLKDAKRVMDELDKFEHGHVTRGLHNPNGDEPKPGTGDAEIIPIGSSKADTPGER